MSARVCLVQSLYGAAAQKAIIQEIMSSNYTDIVTGYLAFMISYSVEDGVTIQDIHRNLSLDDEYSEELIVYLNYARYHVSPFEWKHIRDPVSLIRLEESSSLVDRLDTFLDAAQLLVIGGNNSHALAASIGLLLVLDDVRAKNLGFLLGKNDSAPTEDAKLLEIADRYTFNENVDAELDNLICSEPQSAWFYELRARMPKDIDGPTLPIDGESAAAFSTRIVDAMRDHINATGSPSEVRRLLEQLGVATRSTLAARAIAALLERELDPPVATGATPAQGIWYLSSPIVQPHAFRILEYIRPGVVDRILTESKAAQRSVSVDLLATTCRPDSNAVFHIKTLGLPAQRSLVYTAYAMFNLGEYSEAAKTIAAAKADPDFDLAPRVLSFEYALLRKIDRIDLALQAFSVAYLQDQRAAGFYPLSELAEWAVLEAKVDAVALSRSILLHVYTTNVGPDREGDLSDAFEDALDFAKTLLPSQMMDFAEKSSAIRYFLQFVATIDRLEDTTRLPDLDSIEAERIRVLQWLLENDPVNRSSYTTEIANITKDQEVARLSAQFERSKIYVHEEGVRRVFEVELRPTFERYRLLLQDPRLETVSEEIEIRLKKLLRESEERLRYILLPSTERDSVYFSMLQRAYDLLVLDPVYGLRTYLSTRILHGVLKANFALRLSRRICF